MRAAILHGPGDLRIEEVDELAGALTTSNDGPARKWVVEPR